MKLFFIFMSMILNEKLKSLIKSKRFLTSEHKKKLLKILKEYKDLTENDNYVGTRDNMESNVISKKFTTNADFESYVSQHRGLEILPKEQQAISNYKNIKPSEFTKFFIKYESTDEFSNNTTTIIKKLKEGGKCCWTAFQKIQSLSNSPEEAPIQEADEMPPQNNPPEQNQQTQPQEQPQSQDDKRIEVIKSIPFADELQGSEIISEFLIKLDL